MRVAQCWFYHLCFLQCHLDHSAGYNHLLILRQEVRLSNSFTFILLKVIFVRSVHDLWSTSIALPQLVWTHAAEIYSDTKRRLVERTASIEQQHQEDEDQHYEPREFVFCGSNGTGELVGKGGQNNRMSKFYEDSYSSNSNSMDSLSQMDNNYRDPRDALPPSPKIMHT